MPNSFKFLLLMAGVAVLLAAIGQAWTWYHETRPAARAEQAVTAHEARAQADRAAQRAPDSLANRLAGQRAENARHSTSLRRQDDSLTRLLRPVVLPAVPPREQ